MSERAGLDWDLPSPHVASLAVERADIDAYEHVNNAVYMAWFDRAAWDHSAALGLPIEKCLQLDRGIAVVRSVIAYLRPCAPQLFESATTQSNSNRDTPCGMIERC